MTDRYEAVYTTLLDASAADDPDEPQRIAIPIHREDRLGATTRGR
jgi:hypothetical protein